MGGGEGGAIDPVPPWADLLVKWLGYFRVS